MYFPSFPLENKLFGIHPTCFLPVEALKFSELKTPLAYTFFPQNMGPEILTSTGLGSGERLLWRFQTPVLYFCEKMSLLLAFSPCFRAIFGQTLANLMTSNIRQLCLQHAIRCRKLSTIGLFWPQRTICPFRGQSSENPTQTNTTS